LLRRAVPITLGLCCVVLLPTALPAQDSVDTAAIRQIREEAFDRSQVMEIASWLTDVHGPRLTNSPTSRAGGDWAVKRLTKWGVEHYGRIARILDKGIPVTMDLDIRNRFQDEDLTSFNVLAEIPGGDRADEVVMLGAHFDTWHSGTGATDNSAGSAVMMEAVRPVFGAWMRPFADMGVKWLTLQNTGGTDHLAFDGVGLPGFQFIQDPVEYDTRTHHSNMDVGERLQPADMKLNAAVVAAFVYLAANRQDLLPRRAPGPLTP
jgi:hypothetical protein